MKKTDAVSMVTSAKYDGAFYKTPQTTENTLILFKKTIVYERLVLKLSKNIVFKKFNFSYFFSYRASLIAAWFVWPNKTSLISRHSRL